MSRTDSAVKPNTNAEGQLDTAADPATDPQELVPEGADALRAEEAPENEAATQRATHEHES
ncbi:MAG: hypothetical protein ACFE0J_07400 [Elainellaceae cyanobacterium]